MIIKAMTSDKTKSFRYYDNAREVQCTVGKRQLFNAVKSEDVAEDLFESELAVTSDPDYACITFVDDSGPRHVILNTTAYLMNDEGRTIERLY